MKNIKEIAQKIKELDDLYDKTNNYQVEKEMIEIMSKLSLEDMLEIEKFLTK